MRSKFKINGEIPKRTWTFSQTVRQRTGHSHQSVLRTLSTKASWSSNRSWAWVQEMAKKLIQFTQLYTIVLEHITSYNITKCGIFFMINFVNKRKKRPSYYECTRSNWTGFWGLGTFPYRMGQDFLTAQPLYVAATRNVLQVSFSFHDQILTFTNVSRQIHLRHSNFKQECDVHINETQYMNLMQWMHCSNMQHVGVHFQVAFSHFLRQGTKNQSTLAVARHGSPATLPLEFTRYKYL